jgi:hypothetical protein
MNCAVHTEREASGYCRNCGKALCAECTRAVREVLYCEDCLAKVMGHAGGAATAAPGPVAAAAGTANTGNPGIAFVLGFCPGLGAIYNGEYNKAIIHILVFSMLVAGANTAHGGMEPVFGLSIAGFIFYMAFDALRTARNLRAGTPLTPDPVETWTKEKPVGPILLIALGVMFLLDNFGWLPWERIGRFWPLLLIAAGVMLLRKRLGQTS